MCFLGCCEVGNLERGCRYLEWIRNERVMEGKYVVKISKIYREFGMLSE